MGVLVQYSLTGSSLATTSNDTNVSGGSLTNGSLTSMAADTPGYASDPALVCAPAASATSEATAVTNSSYYSFTVTPGSGVSMNLTTLTFNAARGGAGTPRGYGVRSSIDAYAADIQTADLTTVRPTFSAISVDLTGASYQKLTAAVTFRIYVYAPSTGNSVDFDDITLNGVSFKPAASFFNFMGR